jgi:hypothetical protein
VLVGSEGRVTIKPFGLVGHQLEDAVELYDNIAVTRWLGLTVDLQIGNPGLKKTLTSSGELRDVNTAVIGGLRALARF